MVDMKAEVEEKRNATKAWAVATRLKVKAASEGTSPRHLIKSKSNDAEIKSPVFFERENE